MNILSRVFGVLFLMLMVVPAGCETTRPPITHRAPPRPALSRQSTTVNSQTNQTSTSFPNGTVTQSNAPGTEAQTGSPTTIPAQTPPSIPSSTDVSRIDALLQKIWTSYQQFDYAATTRLRNEMTELSGEFPRQRAEANIITAAAYYVLNDMECMRTCLLYAIEQDVTLVPNQKILPSAVCQMHRELLSARK